MKLTKFEKSLLAFLKEARKLGIGVDVRFVIEAQNPKLSPTTRERQEEK